MQPSLPSRSALHVALRRAAHQLYDQPRLLQDPLAVAMLLPDYAQHLRRTPKRSSSTTLRAFLVARARYAEDALQHAVSLGIRQYLILGAGLDTFAHRNPYAQLRVFELDHPSTQAWKQHLLRRAGIQSATACTYIPFDLEQGGLSSSLQAANFDLSAPAAVASLGVMPYLSSQAFSHVTHFLQHLPAGSGVVLDYLLPRAVLPPHEQRELDSQAARLAQAGEVLQLFFTPESLAARLAAFSLLEDVGAEELNARYFQGRQDDLRVRKQSARILTAWKPLT